MYVVYTTREICSAHAHIVLARTNRASDQMPYIVNLSSANYSLPVSVSNRGSCLSTEFRNQAANSACAGAARLLEITMDSLKIINPSTCNSATYNSLSSYGTSDTLSSRTSTCSSFYSSGYSDDDWDDDSGSGDEINEYRHRLSQESRKRMIRKLDSLRYNPNHHMRRIVPVGDSSTVDGGEVSCLLHSV